MSKNLPAEMLGIRKLTDGPGLTFCSDIPVPTVGPRDVLVAVTHAGICGTDRHIYEWDRWSQSRVKVGITVGHEFVGMVYQVGSAVTRVQPGQRVSAEGHICCGVCEPCRTGNAHVCDTVNIIGIDVDGCFAQFVRIPDENIWPVHPNIPDEVAAIFDPLGNAVHTVMTAGVSARSVLITGAGIIGLMSISVARAAGAGSIYVTDVNPDRLELARQLGADKVYLASEDWISQVKRETDGLGPESMLEMSGHPQAINDGLRAVRNGADVALLGIPAGEVTLNINRDVIFKGLTVHGITGRRMYQTWYQMQRMILSGKLELDSIITDVIDIDDWESGFEKMQSGDAIKVVMRVPQQEDLVCQTAASTSDVKS